MGNIGFGELIILGIIGVMILGGVTAVALLVVHSQKPPRS
jgi:hypothetical protein